MAITRTITIKDNETLRLLADGIAIEHPIPENAGVPLFTKNQWVEEYFRRHLKAIIARQRLREAPPPQPTIDDTEIT